MTQPRHPPNRAYRQAFGERLAHLRKTAGFSQEALALATGISRRYLSGIERGKANPTLDQIVRLATAIDRQPADLLPHTAGDSAVCAPREPG